MRVMSESEFAHCSAGMGIYDRVIVLYYYITTSFIYFKKL